MARTEPLKSKSPFTRITSWLLSPILLEFLCLSCNRFLANQAHPITPLNRLNHRAQKARDKGAQLMNSRLQRKQSPMISKQMAHLMLRGVMPVHLRQILPPNHRNRLRPNNSQSDDAFECSGAPRRPCFDFDHAFNHPLYFHYLCSTIVLWVINTRNNSFGRFRVRFGDRLSPSEVQPKPPRPLKQPNELPTLHNLCSLDLVSWLSLFNVYGLYRQIF